jgi:hypothetical protein
MNKPLEEEETLLQDGTIETSVVGSGTLWKPLLTPWDNIFAPNEVFPNKCKQFSNIKGGRQMIWVFDCFVFLDKDRGIMPKKQICDV